MPRSDAAATALVARRKATDGATVAYTRAAGGAPLTLTVIPGLEQATSRELPGRVELGDRDYLIAIADLMVNGAEVPPARGDRLAETINGTACVFEILTPDTGEPGSRYGSQWRAWYRVHTKQVS